MRYDPNLVYTLLMIVEKCSKHPKLKRIRDEAMAELQTINEGYLVTVAEVERERD